MNRWPQASILAQLRDRLCYQRRLQQLQRHHCRRAICISSEVVADLKVSSNFTCEPVGPRPPFFRSLETGFTISDASSSRSGMGIAASARNAPSAAVCRAAVVLAPSLAAPFALLLLLLPLDFKWSKRAWSLSRWCWTCARRALNGAGTWRRRMCLSVRVLKGEFQGWT